MQHSLYQYLVLPLIALVGLAWVVRRNKARVESAEANSEPESKES